MTNYATTALVLPKIHVHSGKVAWRSPSNLALVKYWGKYGRQLPKNPSISFTLNNAFTETSVEYTPNLSGKKGINLEFYFEEKQNEAFRLKQVKFLESIQDIFPFLSQLNFTIRSHNSFPHSAGIASSASSMSALALCLCSIEKKLFGTLQNEAEFLKKASFVSRLGSGSACRSMYPVMAVWGEGIEGSSNLYAVPHAAQTHEVFHTFHDDILIISKSEKSVSSRAGHALMEGNAYADIRYAQAHARLHMLIHALREGDLKTFGEITENEALTLHALMMTSEPSYLLMEANSLAAINKVRDFRAETNVPLYFSLDAGPNLHLLYPDAHKIDVQNFIENELKPLCEDGKYIPDMVGQGAELMING